MLTKVHIVKAMVFLAVMYGWKSWTIKRLSIKELMPSDHGAREGSWGSHGLQGDQTSQPKGNQPWIFTGRTDVKAEAPILWPLVWRANSPGAKNQLWCWERLKAKGEEGGRGWDGWIASLTQWTWIWAVVEDKGAWHDAVHGVRHNLEIELQQQTNGKAKIGGI